MIAAVVVEDRIHMKLPYALKDDAKASLSAKWAPAAKAWHCSATSHSAAEIVALAGRHGEDLATDPEFDRLLRLAKKADKAQETKVRTDLPDIPTRTEAWSHQRQCFWFIEDGKFAAAMMGMDMGCGKSATAIGVLEQRKAHSILILCPRNVCNVWPHQIAQHAVRQYECVVPALNGTVTKRAHAIANGVARAEARGVPYVVVVNYEAAWRPAMEKYLLAREWDAVILDESHRIKAPGGKASKFCHRLAKRAKTRLCLTGTPLPHSPMDAYAQYRFLDDSIFGTSYTRFRSRYAVMGGFEGRQVMGYQNMDQFNEKFHSIAFVCKADDVLDLPEYHHIMMPFDLGPKSLRAYAALDEEFVLGVGDGTVTIANALTKLLRLQQITSGYVRDDDGVDHCIGTEKADVLRDVLADIDQPVAVFCRFQHDLDVIASVCDELGLTHGELSGRSRDALNEHSQMAEGIDVAIVQIQSGGVGIDLTRASYAVYYSIGWSLGDYEQSLKRVHRPGQTRTTTYIHLVANATKDPVVYDALQHRRDVVEAVIACARQTLDAQ